MSRILVVLTCVVATLGCRADSPTGLGGVSGPQTSSTVTLGGGTMGPMHFNAVLSGEDAGTESLGRGVATFRFSGDGMSMRYRLIVANILDVTMAHIHISDMPGGNGPPGVWLYPSGPPPQLIEGRSAGVLAEGTVTADDLVGPLADMTLSDLMMRIKMGRAYVNVHTAGHPGGEIRGQIDIPSR